MPETIKITYTRSAIGRQKTQKRTIKALGFTKLSQSRIVNDTPSMRGMLAQVPHLVSVEPVPQTAIQE